LTTSDTPAARVTSGTALFYHALKFKYTQSSPTKHFTPESSC